MDRTQDIKGVGFADLDISQGHTREMFTCFFLTKKKGEIFYGIQSDCTIDLVTLSLWDGDLLLNC